MFDWAGTGVKHLRYGDGIVRSCEDGFVNVDFPALGEKRFVYPDVFEKFLKCSDPDAIARVTQDIIFKKAEENAIEREKKQLAETIAAAQQAAEAKNAKTRRRTIK